MNDKEWKALEKVIPDDTGPLGRAFIRGLCEGLLMADAAAAEAARDLGEQLVQERARRRAAEEAVKSWTTAEAKGKD